MARKVRWSLLAAQDFEQASAYIAEYSPLNAAKFTEKVLNRAELLLRSADQHGMVPELNDPGIRETVVDRYRLIYKTTPDEIRILRLLHGSQDFLAHWIFEERHQE